MKRSEISIGCIATTRRPGEFLAGMLGGHVSPHSARAAIKIASMMTSSLSGKRMVAGTPLVFGPIVPARGPSPHGDYRLDNLLFATTEDRPARGGRGLADGLRTVRASSDLSYFIGAGLLVDGPPEQRRGARAQLPRGSAPPGPVVDGRHGTTLWSQVTAATRSPASSWPSPRRCSSSRPAARADGHVRDDGPAAATAATHSTLGRCRVSCPEGEPTLPRLTAMDEFFVPPDPGAVSPIVVERNHDHWRESLFLTSSIRRDGLGDVIILTLAHFPENGR